MIMAHESGNTVVPVVHAATKLRRLLASSDDIIVAPGVYDGFSARIALEVGFECIYMVRTLQ
jgi:methylisocitrate lyase